jgi:signal transduction histidine kinase
MLRLTILGSALAYAVFAILDVYIIPEAAYWAAWIRFGFAIPGLLSVVAFSYARRFPRYSHVAMPAAIAFAGIGILGMIALAGEPGRSFYYAGLLLCILVGSSLAPIGWTGVALVSTLIAAAYQLVAIHINPIAPLTLLNNDFFLAVVLAAGIGSSFVHELKNRRLFIRGEGERAARQQSDVLRIKAEAASHAKSEFLAVMSHELRTPLNAILGFSEMMQMQVFGPIGSERYTAYARDIHESAEHLLGIITDLLDLSTAEVGRLVLHEAEVDLEGLLDHCLRLLRERAASKGIRLSFTGMADEQRVMVRGDERLLKQVVINVLGNALKFTPSGGSVDVASTRHPDERAAIRIVDTGIGIADGDIGRVLEPFFQSEGAFARKHGGAGLGLSLAKKILDLHQGEITIRSTVGAGTEVTLSLPAERIGLQPPSAMAGAA